MRHNNAYSIIKIKIYFLSFTCTLLYAKYTNYYLLLPIITSIYEKLLYYKVTL